MGMKNHFGGVFRNRRVLITGHTGFKGAWLSLWLKELGASVIGYSLNPPTEPNLFETLNLKKEIESIIADVRNFDRLKKVFEKYRPEFVFHLAAQSILRDSYRIPKYTYETNVLGTLNVFEAERQSHVAKVIINVTSDKCYENREWVWGYRETDTMGGFDPYSSSKGCSELLTSSYRSSYFRGHDRTPYLASVRAGNVIGGGDWANFRLVPDCIKALSRSEVIKIRNPRSIRPWQYVLEPLRGYLLLASKMYIHGGEYADAWNFGPEENSSITVQQLVEKIIDYWGEGKWEDLSDRKDDPLHEARYLKLDCSKAIRMLGWKPSVGIDKALEYTVKWYKQFYTGRENMMDYSRKMIEDYCQQIEK